MRSITAEQRHPSTATPPDEGTAATQRDVAVVMACHNRAAKTLRALRALSAQENAATLRLTLYLVDDGCSDGTPELARAVFPRARIIPGNGTLFWGGGMALGFAEAQRNRHRFYLWLNDDTELFPDALRSLFAVHDHILRTRGREPIVVGATVDPSTGAPSYGGIARSSCSPWAYSMVQPSARPVRCVGFHGNCVLIPDTVALAVGGIDARFRHYIGDVDYGFRASRLEIESWVAPRFVGQCARDPAPAGPPPSLACAVAALRAEKGLRFADATLVSFREWWLFSQRHGGWLAVPYFLWPYRRLLRCVLRRRPADG